MVINSGPFTKAPFMPGDIVYAYLQQQYLTAIFTRNKIDYFVYQERDIIAKETKLIEDNALLN